MSGIEEIKNKLESFKRKFYIRQAIVGTLVFLILSVALFLIINSLEYQLWLGRGVRTAIFFGFLLFIILALFFLVFKPLLQIFQLKKGMTDERAAAVIIKSFPELEDKLVNALQLSLLPAQENELLMAAIERKATDFRPFSFIKAVDFSITKKYGFILGSVLLFFFLVSFINPSIIQDSSNRLVNFNKEFAPEAPFQFNILNNSLDGFRGEDFDLQIEITGDNIPSDVFINIEENSRLRLSSKKGTLYQFSFNNIQTTKSFQLEAAGFKSKRYQIQVNERPDLISMSIHVENPSYTGGERRVITNTGDLIILEGSNILWSLSTLSTNQLVFLFNSDHLEVTQKSPSDFLVEKRIFNSGFYDISLLNSFGKNKSSLKYGIDVIQDQFPKIKAEYFPDSTLYQFVTLAGSIADDYGFTSLNLNYRKEGIQKFTSIPLEINKESKSQRFYANWNIDSLSLKSGKRLEFFLSVADNDGVNGFKTSKSNTFILQIPSEEEIEKELSKKSENVEKQLDKSKNKAEDINARLKKLEDKLKANQKYDWQEKKQVNDLVEDREKLAEEIKQLQKQHEALQKANEQFKDQSKELQNKNEELQKLLDELMDEETRKLYEQLKELMKENAPSEQVTQQLEKLQQNEKNLEKELERALELFKRLKMESALEQNLQKLDTLSQKQEKIANENLENSNSKDQKDVKEQFEKFREEMDKIQNLNQELKRPEPMEDFEFEERQIAKELREIQEELENEENQGEDANDKEKDSSESQEENIEKQKEKNKQTQQKQKNAAQRMKNLSQKLSKMQSGMQMEMMQANLDQLRDILDNLVKLSFNQEDLMTEMREVNQSDPRFLELSQAQLKLKDDAKVIQDSLLSLAEKVVQISSFITREVRLINENINQSLDFLKDRNRGRALSSQQFAMTSINNLALLLDDTMQQMQMSMSESMGNKSKGDKKQKGLPDLQEMQNQLGEKMEELKGSGKTGRELSEQLAKMAAEQEMIRRQMEMLKQMQDGKPGGGFGGDDLKKAIDMMEQNEVDLVNKRLTQQLINRQKGIETRMLEAEKAQRQQEMEEERESQAPSVITREIPPGFEEYLKLKQKEIELLKTIPLELNSFYKKEVNDYFRRLSSDDKND
jgi:hypothetical protein